MSDLKLEIAEGQIQNAIAVALAEAFSAERRDQLLRDIVRAHLNHRESSYDRETILAKQVGALIRTIASEHTKRMVESWKPDVERVVEETLGPQFKESVLASLRDGLSKIALYGITVSVNTEKT